MICPKHLVTRYLSPLAEQFNALLSLNQTDYKVDHVEISTDQYVVIEVDGQGLAAGQRVLELTAPLAMANLYVWTQC